MKRVAALVLLLGTTVGIAAGTDRPRPREKTEPKVVPVVTAVDALEDVSDYAFFEVWEAPAEAGRGRPLRAVILHYFQPASAAQAARTRPGTSTLYAVPRTFAEPIPGWAAFAAEGARSGPLMHTEAQVQKEGEDEWVRLADRVRAGTISGGASVPFLVDRKATVTNGTNSVTALHRLTRTPTGLVFAKVEQPPPSAAGETVGKCGNEGPDETVAGRAPAVPRVVWVGGGAVAFMLAVGTVVGLVFFLRRGAQRAIGGPPRICYAHRIATPEG